MFQYRTTMLISVMLMNLFLMASSAEKVKRVLLGDLVYTHDEWNTQHVVVLVRTWRCVSDQLTHEVGRCQYSNFCTGSLLTFDFVITAGHCLMDQVFFEEKHRMTIQEFYWERISGGFKGLIGNPHRYVIKARLHRFYASVAVLAGSPNVDEMNQVRHLERVFPHPSFLYHAPNSFPSKATHDIAMIRVCQKFKKTEDVRIAPLMNLDQLRPSWDKIIQRSAACLVAGFGLVEDPDDYSKQIKTRKLHYTWGYMTCSSLCNRDRSLPFESYRNPCIYCLQSISPLYGIPAPGDSGSPVICGGFYIAMHTAGVANIFLNKTRGVGYGLHCIKNAITPERLEYYRSVDAYAELEFLGPLDTELPPRQSFSGQ